MSDIKTISDVMAELKNNRRNDPKLVRDWKEMLPEGSRWFPNCPGNPACKVCDGIGYLRIEGLPVGHPYFGKLVLCDCTEGRVVPTRPQPEYDAGNLRNMPSYVEQS
jgi:hypothetical protein